MLFRFVVCNALSVASYIPHQLVSACGCCFQPGRERPPRADPARARRSWCIVSGADAMSRKWNRQKPPSGWDYIEPTMDAFDREMRTAVDAPHEGFRKAESQWPIHQINWQRSRYIYDLFYKASFRVGMEPAPLGCVLLRAAAVHAQTCNIAHNLGNWRRLPLPVYNAVSCSAPARTGTLTRAVLCCAVLCCAVPACRSHHNAVQAHLAAAVRLLHSQQANRPRADRQVEEARVRTFCLLENANTTKPFKQDLCRTEKKKD